MNKKDSSYLESNLEKEKKISLEIDPEVDRLLRDYQYKPIKEFERWVNETIKKIESSDVGLSSEGEAKIMVGYLRQCISVKASTVWQLPRFMIDNDEMLRFEQLKSKLEITIALARDRYKVNKRKDIVKVVKSIATSVTNLLHKLP
ncbi:hypothetical protein [Methanothermococcus okinawensis]|uniref:Uncharacterized protein n=1 Tax=Methanothermococcus okinawensis (strain DSM 14208 / JCM 11175 / IH1) TaxID=647113 RepID=F8AP19_METOI|nr:hypothetical protein [Methanothermococcus okinawensis]AEH07587.1 hypothetical protein Metok_1625 [Methanothermococcus okinawensis IH1]